MFFNLRKNLGIKPGLERMHELLSRLGHPEKKIKAIHIAGTNGKGSTLHFLNAALQANHYRTGVFTSPSFSGLTGHILLNDHAIDESEFIKIFKAIYPTIVEMDKKDMAPTEFEILTTIAFVYFSNNGEIVLIETGMGGRFDTTNVINPLLSIITTISMDHIDYLGETLEEIAFHKAGIIKAHAPVIVGEMDSTALQVILKEAKQKQSDCYVFDKDFSYEKQSNTQEVYWKSKKNRFPVSLSMKGEHQFKNVSLALKALEIIENMGFPLNWNKVLTGVFAVNAPGRYELLHVTPTVIADAAHNTDGIRALIHTANKDYPTQEKYVITAMFKDKDVEEMLELLCENFTSVTLTTFDHPRAASVNELLAKAGAKMMDTNEDWQALINRCIEQEDKIYYITGSLHFITLVRDYFVHL